MRYGRGNPKEGNPKRHVTAPLGDSRAPAYRHDMYATRPMHDADSHIMEPPAWLEPPLEAKYRAKLPALGPADDSSRQGFDVDPVRRAHAIPQDRAEDQAPIMLRKNFLATGSFINYSR